MTYKAAVAGLNLGGGKSVIIGDNKIRNREPIFRAHGRHVKALGGRYITAEDVGTSVGDMEFIKAETDHVTGLIGKSGDPSPVTAFGVYRGSRRAPGTITARMCSRARRWRSRAAATSAITWPIFYIRKGRSWS